MLSRSPEMWALSLALTASALWAPWSLGQFQHGAVWLCSSGDGLPRMGKMVERTAWLWGAGNHFVVHPCLGHQGNNPVLAEFSYIVSSVDVKHFIYWTLISQFQINQIFNFLLGVCANDCLVILFHLLIHLENFMWTFLLVQNGCWKRQEENKRK